MPGMEESRLRNTWSGSRPCSWGRRRRASERRPPTARQRVRAGWKSSCKSDPPIEHQFSLSNVWSRRFFLALLRRYGINPYRYPRQKYNTVMARASSSFVHETLWPEFLELDKILCTSWRRSPSG